MLHNHVMYLYVKQNHTFTNADKKECLPMLEKILKASEITRNHGLLALDAQVHSAENPYLKEAFTLLADAADPEMINAIFEKHIFFGNHTNKEILELLLITEGATFIMNGNSPYHILLELEPYFGKEFESETRKIYDAVHVLGNKINSVG